MTSYNSIIKVVLLASAGVIAIASPAAAVTAQDLPKGAHAGECFSRIAIPPVYRTERSAVAGPPVVSYRDIPAAFRTLTKQLLVTPARVDRQTIPAVTSSRTRYVDHPGADRVVETAAVYRWEVRRVLVRAAHLEWRQGHAAQGYGEGAGEGVRVQPTGEVLCRVLVPARYETRRVRVLVTPARTCLVKGPVAHERVVEQFVVSPARVVEHPVAPVYRAQSERVLVTPARRERIETPGAPRYVEKKVLVRPGSSGWTRIACKAPAPPRRVHPLPPPPHPIPVHGGQCHTHTVCEDAPYAQPHPGAELYGAPSYHAPVPQPSQSYGADAPR